METSYRQNKKNRVTTEHIQNRDNINKIETQSRQNGNKIET